MQPTSTPFAIPTKILVPMDFSPSSYAALDMATDLAQHFHAELSLVNVVPMLANSAAGMEYYPETTLINAETGRAEQELAACTASLVSKGLRASSNVEIGNDVVGNIMMVADREHADMIVLSTHGTSGWRPVVFGSIAEKVVKLAKCPLMLLRSLAPVVVPEPIPGAA